MYQLQTDTYIHILLQVFKVAAHFDTLILLVLLYDSCSLVHTTTHNCTMYVHEMGLTSWRDR